MLAVSELWRGLLGDLRRGGEEEVVEKARAALRSLYAVEVLLADRTDAFELAVLREDLRKQQTYRRLEF